MCLSIIETLGNDEMQEKYDVMTSSNLDRGNLTRDGWHRQEQTLSGTEICRVGGINRYTEISIQ